MAWQAFRAVGAGRQPSLKLRLGTRLRYGIPLRKAFHLRQGYGGQDGGQVASLRIYPQSADAPL